MEQEGSYSESTIQQQERNMSQIGEKAQVEILFIAKIPAINFKHQILSTFMADMEIVPEYRGWFEMIIRHLQQHPQTRKQIDESLQSQEESEEESPPRKPKTKQKDKPTPQIATLKTKKSRTLHYRHEEQKHSLSSSEEYELAALKTELEEAKASQLRAIDQADVARREEMIAKQEIQRKEQMMELKTNQLSKLAKRWETSASVFQKQVEDVSKRLKNTREQLEKTDLSAKEREEQLEMTQLRAKEREEQLRFEISRLLGNEERLKTKIATLESELSEIISTISTNYNRSERDN